MAKNKVSPARKRRKSAKKRVVDKAHVNSPDATPDYAIRFGKAYDIVLERYKEKPKKGTYHEFWRGNVDPDKTLSEDEIDLEAEYLFRQLLDGGQLLGCVRDPLTREILNLSTDIWLSEPSGFDGDYLIPHDSSRGNGTNIGEVLRPVFFLKEHFDRWLRATFEDRQSKKHRERIGVAFDSAKNAIKEKFPNGQWSAHTKDKVISDIEEFFAKSSDIRKASRSRIRAALDHLYRTEYRGS